MTLTLFSLDSMKARLPSEMVAQMVKYIVERPHSYIGSNYNINCYLRGVDAVAEHLINGMSEIQKWDDLLAKIGLTYYFWRLENPMKVYETDYKTWVKHYLRPDVIKRLCKK